MCDLSIEKPTVTIKSILHQALDIPERALAIDDILLSSKEERWYSASPVYLVTYHLLGSKLRGLWAEMEVRYRQIYD